MSAMTVCRSSGHFCTQYRYYQRDPRHENVPSQHFQKAREFAYMPAYHHSSASQLSLSGFLNVVLSAQNNVIRAVVKLRTELFVTAIMGPDAVA